MTAPSGGGRRRTLLWLGVFAVALVLTLIGCRSDPREAYFAWLTAFAAGVSIALGALILVAVTHLTGARWFDPLRRIALDVAATLPLFALLFLFLVPGLGSLYSWIRVPPDGNAAYLNRTFFLIRAAGYFALWSGVALTLRRWARSAAPDASRAPAVRERVLAALALPAIGLTLTFAAFDWIMSLTPGWTSTVFGVYWFAGGFLGALALVSLIASRHARALDDDRRYALGALLLTFAVFWAYIAYMQYFIVWIADIPAEAAWYIPRVHGSWATLAAVLLAGQFLIPFLLLLPHAAKTSARLAAPLAGWLLVMHYLDMYWLVLPTRYPAGMHPHWLDLAALLTIAAAMGACISWLGDGRHVARLPQNV